MSDLRAELQAANTGFYRAFEALDLAAMDEVWARGTHVACIHPGWPLVRGWAAVRDSWATIFTNTEEMRFVIEDVRVVAADGLGVVTCLENILSGFAGRISVTSVLATNVFERGHDQWKMVLHHASHVQGERRRPTSP